MDRITTTEQTDRGPLFAVHLDQKYIGAVNSHAAAVAILAERANFERVATIRSGADTVDIYVCRAPGGIFNYAYASVTITGG